MISSCAQCYSVCSWIHGRCSFLSDEHIHWRYFLLVCITLIVWHGLHHRHRLHHGYGLNYRYGNRMHNRHGLYDRYLIIKNWLAVKNWLLVSEAAIIMLPEVFRIPRSVSKASHINTNTKWWDINAHTTWLGCCLRICKEGEYQEKYDFVYWSLHGGTMNSKSEENISIKSVLPAKWVQCHCLTNNYRISSNFFNILASLDHSSAFAVIQVFFFLSTVMKFILIRKVKMI